MANIFTDILDDKVFKVVFGVRCKTMCLGIDVLKSEEEVFDIGYSSELSPEVLDFGVEGFGRSIR